MIEDWSSDDVMILAKGATVEGDTLNEFRELDIFNDCEGMHATDSALQET